MKINVSQELLSEIIKDRVKKALNEQKAETKPTMVKIKLSELKEVIKQVIKEENEEFKTSFNDNDPQISEAKNFILGEGYTHFAIDKSTGKIATGWEYNGVEKEDIQYYSKLDLNDMFPDRKASEFKIVTRKYLEKSGINPADQNNWLLSSSDQTNMQ